jgi:hypothetical protein
LASTDNQLDFTIQKTSCVVIIPTANTHTHTCRERERERESVRGRTSVLILIHQKELMVYWCGAIIAAPGELRIKTAMVVLEQC